MHQVAEQLARGGGIDGDFDIEVLVVALDVAQIVKAGLGGFEGAAADVLGQGLVALLIELLCRGGKAVAGVRNLLDKSRQALQRQVEFVLDEVPHGIAGGQLLVAVVFALPGRAEQRIAVHQCL